jgi:hypothetical protein
MSSKINTCYYTQVNGFIISDIPTCLKGMYCPEVKVNDKSTAPQLCLPSTECELDRLQGRLCKNINGTYGAQGRYEPVLCPPGKYCASPDSIQSWYLSNLLISSPPGFFCPTGTFIPKPCDILSICPVESVSQRSLVGITVCAAVDVLLLIIYYFSRRNDNLVPSRNSLSGDEAKRRLIETFEKSSKGKDLRINYDIKGLSCSLPSGRVILDNISLSIREARMTAILGPSGAGKTTILNVISGKNDRYVGSIEVCGNATNLTSLKKVIGFVPQVNRPVTLTIRMTRC